MANAIAVSVTADIADLQVKRAILSQELKDATKDLNDFAKAAKSGGTTDELRASMLKAGDAVAKAKAQISGVDAELKRLTQTTHGHSEALGLNRMQMITGQSAVMRFTDSIIAGQSPIRAFALEAHKLGEMVSMDSGGMAGGMAKVAAIATPMNAAIAATVAVLAAATVAGMQYQEAQKALYASTVGVGAASGMTAEQLTAAGSAASEWSGQSKAASTEAAQAFAAAGVQSQASITALAGDVQIFAALTGEKAAEAQKTLAESMQDPIKGAKELNASLGILDSTQMEQIRTLTDQGDKEGAVAILTQALQQRMDDAKAAGIGLNSTWQNMTSSLGNLWDWLGKANSRLEEFTNLGLQASAVEAQIMAQREAAGNRAHVMTTLNDASVAGAAEVAKTPEGRERAKHAELVASMGRLGQALIADTALHGANSEAARRDAEALSEYTRAVNTYLPAAEKAHRISELDAKLAEAKRGHDKAKVKVLTEEKARLSTAGEVMSSDQARQMATDAGGKAEAGTGGGSKKHGPSVVSEWSEQLHAQEIASGEYFKDQTAGELAFWQSKVGLTKAGSKEWLEIQAKIYEAQKGLARQDYQDHIATLNERLEADHNNWTRVQADWTEKLAYIKGKFGEESAEYKNAYREMERAQRQHDDQELRETRQSIQRQMDLRKSELNAQQRSREADAQGATSIIQADAGSSLSPIAEASAAVQIGQIHRQLSEQKMAEIEQFHTFEAELLDKAIADATAKYGEDVARYRDLIDLKKKADQDYANSKRELEAQSRAESLRDVLAVRQGYTQAIGGMVSATTSGFLHMAAGQQSWAGMAKNLYSSVLNTIDQRVASFVTNWIAQHLLMTAAERAQIAMQTAGHVAGEVAKTGATMAGTAARVASTAVGAQTSAAITGAHNLKEITSHAATAAAAAYHAMAGIPVVGPVLGAIAAATTFVAVEAFGALASFDKGTNSLPSDMIAQVHRGERIVPAADNQAMIAALKGGGGKAAGDTHLTYAPQLSGDTKPFHRQLEDHSNVLASMISRMMRDGVLRSA